MAYNFVSTSTQYISSSSPSMNVHPTTISAWIYANSNTAAMTVVNFSQTSANFGFRLTLAGQLATDPVRAASVSSATTAIATIGDGGNPNGFNVNTWHHVCGVFTSSSSRTVYRDGVVGSTSSVFVDVTNLTSIFIGALSGGTTLMNGYISDMAIWSVALNTGEINSLAKGFSAKRIRPQSLTYYVPLIRNLQEYRGNITLTNNNTATVIQHNRMYS
jgi:hypothetical protein